VQDALPQLGSRLPKPSQLPDSLREQYQTVVGDTIGELFLYIAPLAGVAWLCILLIPATRLADEHLHEELEWPSAPEGTTDDATDDETPREPEVIAP
jgi:hypothetical protein